MKSPSGVKSLTRSSVLKTSVEISLTMVRLNLTLSLLEEHLYYWKLQ